MYIMAKLPPTYGAFRAIQEHNYPFNRTFVHYVRSVARLAAIMGTDVMTTIGMIEDRLLFVGSTPNVNNTQRPITFKIRVDGDAAIERFYASDPELSNKTVTLLLVRLAIALAEVYKPSLTHMGYLISQLAPSQTQAPMVDRRADAIVQPVVQPVIQPVVQPVAPAPVVESPRRTGKIVIPNDLGDVVSEVSDKADALVARAEQTVARARTTLSETRAEPGQTVETNPLLGQFMDF